MNNSIYSDISRRTGGNIYLGIVGPVRSGKSTFISKFMNTLVLPNIRDDYRRERANDELPQSSAGKTIMTTEPKFVPEEAAKIYVDDGVEMNVRLIDCVGYIIPSAIGYIENEAPRMVATPWFEEPVPSVIESPTKEIRRGSSYDLLSPLTLSKRFTVNLLVFGQVSVANFASPLYALT